MNRRSLFKALAASPLAALVPGLFARKVPLGIEAVANDYPPSLRGKGGGLPTAICHEIVEVRFTKRGPSKYQWKYDGPEWARKEASRRMYEYLNTEVVKTPTVVFPLVRRRPEGVGFVV